MNDLGPPLPDGSVLNFTGNGTFGATSLQGIDGCVGNFNIVHEPNGRPGSAAGQIGKITNTHGNLLLCGFSVGTIGVDAVDGNIVVVGGNVGNIEHFHGNLTIIGGRILGSIIDSTGNISVR